MTLNKLEAHMDTVKELDIGLVLAECRSTIDHLAHIGKKNTERAIAAEEKLSTKDDEIERLRGELDAFPKLFGVILAVIPNEELSPVEDLEWKKACGAITTLCRKALKGAIEQEERK